MSFQTDGLEIDIDSQSIGLRKQANLRAELDNDQ